MIGTKPNSTNAIDYFLQTVTKVVTIFPEIYANFCSSYMLLFNITSYFIRNLRKHLNNIYLSVHAQTCIHTCVYMCP